MVFTKITRRGSATSSCVARVLVVILVVLMCCAGTLSDVSASSAAFKIEYTMLDGVNKSLAEVSKPFLKSRYGGKIPFDYSEGSEEGAPTDPSGGESNLGEDGSGDVDNPTETPGSGDEAGSLTLKGSNGMALSSVLEKMDIQSNLALRLEFTDGTKLNRTQIDDAILVSVDNKNYYILYDKDDSGKYNKAADINNLEVLYYKKPALCNTKNKTINSIKMETKSGSYSVKLNVRVPEAYVDDFKSSATWESSDTKKMTVRATYGKYNAKTGMLPVTLNYYIYKKGKAKLTVSYKNLDLLSQSVTTSEKKSNSSSSTTGSSTNGGRSSYSYNSRGSSSSSSYSSSSETTTSETEEYEDDGGSSDFLYGVDVPDTTEDQDSEMDGLDIDTSGYSPLVGGAVALMLLGGGATAAGSFNLQTAGSVLGKRAAKKKVGKAAAKAAKTAGITKAVGHTADSAAKTAGVAEGAGHTAGVAEGAGHTDSTAEGAGHTVDASCEPDGGAEAHKSKRSLFKKDKKNQ